jgi:hypothetical protein
LIKSAAPAPKDEQMPTMGMAGRQPDPRAARHRDHRRRLRFANAFIGAVTFGASTAPVIRIHPPVANSISITPALSANKAPQTPLRAPA